jgi:imidazolonepropionase-like amidohydrolase
MGLPGIAEGAPADLVAYAADPRADLAALDEPALLILDGRLLPTPAVV